MLVVVGPYKYITHIPHHPKVFGQSLNMFYTEMRIRKPKCHLTIIFCQNENDFIRRSGCVLFFFLLLLCSPMIFHMISVRIHFY